ncbi:MAG: YggN family protein [Gammaproteobacteria bacterium]|nr:YggN family protein [Gammaproteobacteria bacterium]
MRYLIFCLLLALPMSPVYAHNACSNFDNDEIEIDINGDVEIDDDVFTFENRGRELVRIDADRRLFIKGEEVAVTHEQKKLLDDYVEEFKGFEQDAIELGMEAARFGVSTAFSAVLMALTDKDEQEFENQVEERAEEIEEYANALCRRIERVHDIEGQLASEIPEFIPLVGDHFQSSI